MAETLARKPAKRKALRFKFEKLVSQVQFSIQKILKYLELRF